MKYIVNTRAPFDEGGSAEFYPISGKRNIGFKQFRDKKFATAAWKKQKLLSKFSLAPKVLSQVIKLPIIYKDYCDQTNWGFITEKARVIDEKIMRTRMDEIQNLVETIYKKTRLKFWDCHYYNIGYIKRNNKSKLVCIDTGHESFLRDSNAWGFASPGPKCNYCNKYQCLC